MAKDIIGFRGDKEYLESAFKRIQKKKNALPYGVNTLSAFLNWAAIEAINKLDKK